MKAVIRVMLAVSAVALACGSARADYTGQTITGTLAFGPDGTYGGQYWSPDTVVVPGSFYYSDYANTDTATFTGTTLTVTDVDNGGANGWEMTFADPAMPFTSLTEVSDDFSPDMTYSLSGGVITLDWVGTDAEGVTYTATFDIGGATPPAPTPEPSSLALFGTALLGGVAAFRRRFV